MGMQNKLKVFKNTNPNKNKTTTGFDLGEIGSDKMSDYRLRFIDTKRKNMYWNNETTNIHGSITIDVKDEFMKKYFQQLMNYNSKIDIKRCTFEHQSAMASIDAMKFYTPNFQELDLNCSIS